jgi:acetyl-CoA carboxylase carboxyl transferase subunit alpha
LGNKENTPEGEVTMSDLTAWDRVLIARSTQRPTSLDFISAIFNKFMELHGDRVSGDDGAIVAGIAFIDDISVTVIGQQKGRSIKQNLKRNYGMANPKGYRKALRLMKQAEKFNRPIICFIDTPGAFCGIEAEEKGQGEAIARNLYEMSAIRVPILSIVIGEGGSGGALALAVANEVWMLENATYSILSPEGFASILWKDSKRASEAAEVMKITAADLKELNIIERIIPEKETLHLDNMETVAAGLRADILDFISRYRSMPKEEIVARRYERFRNM